MACMDLVRFFIIIILPPEVGVEYSYRLPRIRAISPTASMDFIRFFFIDIVVTSKIEIGYFLQVAQDSQHFAVAAHGLDQILHSIVLHNIYPPK